MNIHEFQAKRLLEKYGIPVLNFLLSPLTRIRKPHPKERIEICCPESSDSCRGAGKGGGVKIARTPKKF